MESDFQLRTKEKHAKQCDYISRPGISVSEKSHYSKVYGINRKSVLMEMPEFDVTQHLPQDIMHVLLEGIFPLHMEQFVDYIVNQAHLLTLDQINSRVMAFPYSYFSERPSPLQDEIIFQGKQSGNKILYS